MTQRVKARSVIDPFVPDAPTSVIPSEALWAEYFPALEDIDRLFGLSRSTARCINLLPTSVDTPRDPVPAHDRPHIEDSA